MSSDKRYCDGGSVALPLCDWLKQPAHEDAVRVEPFVISMAVYQRQSVEVSRYSSLLPMLIAEVNRSRVG